MLYAYPKLSAIDLGFFRLLGPGLGNLLFPWARSILAAKDFGLIPIFPTWPQIKIGPILRGEKDTRFYNGIFYPTKNYISGFKKFYLLMRAQKITEPDFMSGRYDKNIKDSRVVLFKGLGPQDNWFSPIVARYSLIFKELKKITVASHRRGLHYDFKNSISVHVRLGDFSVPQSEDILKNGAYGYRIPLRWYRKQIMKIRKTIAKNIKVFVFSNGSNKELADLLNMDGVTRLSFGSSIADLLALSKANLLITSGSIFSQWAAFLGRMPTIWYPGQLREHLYSDHPEREIECEEEEELPVSFLKGVKLYE